MDERKEFGKWGEEQAKQYLKKNGYVIVAENYRCSQGEIDLIATQGRVLHFVEVKSRRSLSCGYPAESVHKKKQNKIRGAALCFLQEYREAYYQLSFDVIEVYCREKQVRINYLPGCF